MAIKDLNFICGGKKVPGTYYLVYFISKCDVNTDAWPGKKVTTAVGDSITLDGNIALKPGAIWAQVVIISDTGKITHSSEGSKTSKSWSNALDFKMDKTIGSDEWFNDIINFEGIVLVREKVGRYRVFGEPGNWAYFETAEGTLGDVPGSESAWIAKIKDTVGEIAPIYEGIITNDLQLGGFSSGFSSGFNI